METVAAYYCFVNLGWPPSRYDSLPYREKRLVTEFVLKSIKDNEKQKKEAQRR
jgi:hypothetical protein